MADDQEEKIELIISDRPQISVCVNKLGEAEISVAQIASDFESVEINTVSFPLECAKEVGQALIRLSRKKRA